MLVWQIYLCIAIVAVLLACIILYLINKLPLDVVSTTVECTIDVLIDA